MKPAISISIPVYNVAQWLPRALDSIREQTFTDWEAICVDDGSMDGSGDILDDYAQKDSRFHIVHQKNGGENLARQAALERSTGKWIASVDGDDWISPHYLHNLYIVAETTLADVIISDFFEEANGISKRSVQAFNGSATQFQERMLAPDGLWGAMWNKLYSHEFLLKHGISHPGAPKMYVCEDLCFNVTVAAANPRVVYADCCDYHYCVRDGSALQSTFSTARFYSGMHVNDWLLKYATTDLARSFIEMRKKELKANAYSLLTIADADFFAVYPEVRNLWGIRAKIWHKVFYWLSVRGCRRAIVIGFNVFRWLKRLSNARS